MKRLGWRDFAELFGVDATNAPRAIEAALSANFNLRPLTTGEQRYWIGVAFEGTRLEPRKPDWKDFWSEHRFGDEPKYLTRPGRPIRYRGDLMMPESPRFEADFWKVERAFLFDRFFQEDGHAFYDFGAGTGHNSVAYLRQFRNRQVIASDRNYHPTLTSGVLWNSFDLTAPPRISPLLGDSYVFTSGALEQTGDQWKRFLWYLIENRPAVVLNVEPMLELYDLNDPLDSIAAAYHRLRRYLSGYLTTLKRLETLGRIEILECHRVKFGSLSHEGYGWVAWRPN